MMKTDVVVKDIQRLSNRLSNRGFYQNGSFPGQDTPGFSSGFFWGVYAFASELLEYAKEHPGYTTPQELIEAFIEKG